MRTDRHRFDRRGNDVFAEILEVVVEAPFQRGAVEKVDAHRRLVKFAVSRETEFSEQWFGNAQAAKHRVVRRFFDKARDAPLRVRLHDAESLRFAARDRDGRNGQFRSGGKMGRHEFTEVHLVKLVAAEDEEIIPRAFEEIAQVLPHGVRRSLIPTGAGRRLLRGQNFDEAARAEDVELVRPADVLVQRHAVELREHVDAADAGVETIADRDVDEAVFAPERHGRLGAVFGQRVKPLARSAAHDDTQSLGEGGFCLEGVGHHIRGVAQRDSDVTS